METLMVDLNHKLFITRISYFGVIGTAMCWSLFIAIYSNNDRFLTPKINNTPIFRPQTFL